MCLVHGRYCTGAFFRPVMQHCGGSVVQVPVLLVLEGVLAVECGCPAVHTIGWGDADILFLPRATFWEVQHKFLLIGREVGRYNSWKA